ncbi:GlsB/YeaQ/YmgE family stress response membrane protein [Marinilongibacter aquaticus]|uniref:GlsB/YeaQ/YmgE family stress response membrane protein n=1 Tax=Marinilongibacter aquaticus TaxID=2975157 RepID=UPI0021BD65FC|nr:GlsB/YeaQ/YmgE family stress response membrane protein [Marinilongibacter aquaticus]UBM57245.1 GlsB/YeaQ/YmgE family stress response membrane protein [Marinilongibacter aquaticus]
MGEFLYMIIVGAVSGWLAGLIKNGFGFGLLGNIIVGIIGAFLGSKLFAFMGISIGSGTIGTIITSVIGALVLLFIIGLFKRK